MPSLASPILLVTMRANILLTFLFLLLTACQPKAPRDINIGFIGPLTGNAIDFGVGPAQAMTQAVEEYNEQRQPDQPQVNFFIEDDQWTGENAIPLYDNLRKEHGVELLLISHTDGTIALQEKVLADRVILINSLNNDALLSSMNENTFMIGKKTEEAAQTVAARVIELGLKKVAGLYVTNRFMEISAETFREHLAKQWVEDRQKCIAVGMHDYLPKPISRQKLLAILERWLPHRNSGSEDFPNSLRSERKPAFPTPRTDQSKDPSVFSKSKLQDLMMGDETLVREIAQGFLDYISDSVEQIHDAFALKDLNRVLTAAHTIKGEAHNVSCYALGAATARIEDAAQVGQLEKCLFEELELETDRAISAIEMFLGSN